MDNKKSNKQNKDIALEPSYSMTCGMQRPTIGQDYGGKSYRISAEDLITFTCLTRMLINKMLRGDEKALGDCTWQQCFILHYLASNKNENRNKTDIARAIGILKEGVTAPVGGLVKKGYVERNKTNDMDGREKYYKLTEKGIERHDQLIADINSKMEPICNALSGRAQLTMDTMLNAMAFFFDSYDRKDRLGVFGEIKL